MKIESSNNFSDCIYCPAPVDCEPDVVLSEWFIFELPDKTHHFCGFNEISKHGRVSSDIKNFDKEKMIGFTKSNRQYKLIGEFGTNSDALYVYAIWLRINKIESSDVKIISIEDLNG